mmetsp:Transcript_11504/g.43168  ORF Transcript_11504/g.43168 Transcript_11504/m.43168 type:complete len:280 (+) Transcript_11504:779-1618(+)
MEFLKGTRRWVTVQYLSLHIVLEENTRSSWCIWHTSMSVHSLQLAIGSEKFLCRGVLILPLNLHTVHNLKYSLWNTSTHESHRRSVLSELIDRKDAINHHVLLSRGDGWEYQTWTITKHDVLSNWNSLEMLGFSRCGANTHNLESSEHINHGRFSHIWKSNHSNHDAWFSLILLVHDRLLVQIDIFQKRFEEAQELLAIENVCRIVECRILPLFNVDLVKLEIIDTFLFGGSVGNLFLLEFGREKQERNIVLLKVLSPKLALCIRKQVSLVEEKDILLV